MSPSPREVGDQETLVRSHSGHEQPKTKKDTKKEAKKQAKVEKKELKKQNKFLKASAKDFAGDNQKAKYHKKSAKGKEPDESAPDARNHSMATLTRMKGLHASQQLREFLETDSNDLLDGSESPGPRRIKLSDPHRSNSRAEAKDSVYKRMPSIVESSRAHDAQEFNNDTKSRPSALESRHGPSSSPRDDYNQKPRYNGSYRGAYQIGSGQSKTGQYQGSVRSDYDPTGRNRLLRSPNLLPRPEREGLLVFDSNMSIKKSKKKKEKYERKPQKSKLVNGQIRAKKSNKNKSVKIRLKKEVWHYYAGSSKRGRCYCCRCPLSRKKAKTGYVVPRRRRGMRRFENMRPICRACHKSVGRKTGLWEYLVRHDLPGSSVLTPDNPFGQLYHSVNDLVNYTVDLVGLLENLGHLTEGKADEVCKKLSDPNKSLSSRVELMHSIEQYYLRCLFQPGDDSDD